MKHYDSVSEFTDGFATVTIDDNCGLIDSEYNEITEIKYKINLLPYLIKNTINYSLKQYKTYYITNFTGCVIFRFQFVDYVTIKNETKLLISNFLDLRTTLGFDSNSKFVDNRIKSHIYNDRFALFVDYNIAPNDRIGFYDLHCDTVIEYPDLKKIKYISNEQLEQEFRKMYRKMLITTFL